MPKNLGVDTFPDPVGHFGAHWRQFWILQAVRRSSRWASALDAARLVFLNSVIFFWDLCHLASSFGLLSPSHTDDVIYEWANDKTMNVFCKVNLYFSRFFLIRGLFLMLLWEMVWCWLLNSHGWSVLGAINKLQHFFYDLLRPPPPCHLVSSESMHGRKDCVKRLLCGQHPYFGTYFLVRGYIWWLSWITFML